MNPELDALLIRSLPEINDAAIALYDLNVRIGRELDHEVQTWLSRNGWVGQADWNNAQTWLAPAEWLVPDAPAEDQRTYLWFAMDHTSASTENIWSLASLTGCGEERVGLYLYYDTYSIKKASFNRLWRDQKGKSLPLDGSDFFLPLEINREALAAAAAVGTIADALDAVRATLDRLPQFASQLEGLKRSVAEAAKATTSGQAQTSSGSAGE